ncbi:META domain-containing protein [Chlorobium sp.]|uniref:META domain-containing protein n=1 Tax=Chlorobium sp. TaxID=1095 RepID=UPI002F3ED85A
MPLAIEESISETRTVKTMNRNVSVRAAILPLYSTLLILLFAVTGCTVQYARPDRPGGVRPDESPRLFNTTWRAVEIMGRKASFYPGQKMDAHIILNSYGRVSGSTGCNNLNGSYTSLRGRLSFGSIGTTRMACSPRIMEQERRFLDALRITASYDISGRRLILFDNRGRTVMELVAAR